MVSMIQRGYLAGFTVLAAMLLIAVMASSSLASPGDTIRVSEDSSGAEANARSLLNDVSANGRYVAFASNATNLVPGDTNGRTDIFVRDLQTGTTERVSVDSSEGQANGNSPNLNNGGPLPSISADGRYVAFTSDATNLGAEDTNEVSDVFVRDLQAGTTQRVSLDSYGTQADSSSGGPSISANGSHVAFTSGATNLVAGDTNGVTDVFVHERREAATQPGDGVAPTTTARAITTNGPYEPGTWTNKAARRPPRAGPRHLLKALEFNVPEDHHREARALR